MKTNHMQIQFDAKSVNEGFARVAVAAFLTELNPTLDEIADVKTAVSEAVTNAIIHGYPDGDGEVRVCCKVDGRQVHIMVEDKGVGIEDIKKAREPLFTTKPELERSGMGFAFMEAFMDEVQVTSKPGHGTCVIMKKEIGKQDV